MISLKDLSLMTRQSPQSSLIYAELAELSPDTHSCTAKQAKCLYIHIKREQICTKYSKNVFLKLKARGSVYVFAFKSMSHINELSPQSKEVLGLDPGASFYMPFERSPHVCVDLLWLLHFPPTDRQQNFLH